VLLPPDRVVHLAAGDIEVDVDLAEGARAIRWSVAGIDLLAAHGSDPVEHGMYPMAPWAGRLRGNHVQWLGAQHDLPLSYDVWAIHGTVLRQPAVELDFTQDDDRATLVARVTDHPGWPWATAVDIHWEVAPASVTTTVTVRALAESFPVVVGWHPWFRRSLGLGDPLEWTLEATGQLEKGSDQLPTGRVLPFDPAAGPFDDAFIVPSGRATVCWPGALAIDIASDSGWYVVFDELPECVCIEPQSGPPDGLHAAYGSPVAIAAPDAPVTMVTTWSVRDLSQ
jgi:aldose 1-epimerase